MSAVAYVCELMGGKQDFADWLERALADTGISPARLARDSGVSQGQISRYRRAETLPDPETIRKLATALSSDVDEVLIIAGHREGDAPLANVYVLKTANPKVLRIAQLLEDRSAAKGNDLDKAERLLETLFDDEG